MPSSHKSRAAFFASLFLSLSSSLCLEFGSCVRVCILFVAVAAFSLVLLFFLIVHWVFVFINLFTSFVHCLLCVVACCVCCQYRCPYSVSSWPKHLSFVNFGPFHRTSIAQSIPIPKRMIAYTHTRRARLLLPFRVQNCALFIFFRKKREKKLNYPID